MSEGSTALGMEGKYVSRRVWLWSMPRPRVCRLAFWFGCELVQAGGVGWLVGSGLEENMHVVPTSRARSSSCDLAPLWSSFVGSVLRLSLWPETVTFSAASMCGSGREYPSSSGAFMAVMYLSGLMLGSLRYCSVLRRVIWIWWESIIVFFVCNVYGK